MAELPVYRIQSFDSENLDEHFYANYVKAHISKHHFTHLPHKHDFYLVILFTAGSGTHEIDFKSYSVEPGTLFLMKPGQMHYWNLSEDIEGFVFFHSRDFYDEGSRNSGIKDFQFFNSFEQPPVMHLEHSLLSEVQKWMGELVREHYGKNLFKWQKIHSIINLIYIELARNYQVNQQIVNQTYLQKVRKFEVLIDDKFKQFKFAKDYALILNITEKHLNRITQSCLGKTSTQLITERVILEAKRMLIYSHLNVSQVSEELGFNENSYFVRYFRKNTGLTPLGFLKTYVERAKK